MGAVTQFLADEAATKRIGQQIARVLESSPLQQPLVFSFEGQIGAGKTTLIRALLRQLGVEGAIKSPTFAIVEEYDLPIMQVIHFDCYRINDPQELDYIGFHDYFKANTLCLIEWPELAGDYLPTVDLCFSLNFQHNGRELQLTPHTQAGCALLNSLG